MLYTMKKVYLAGCGGMLGEAFYSIMKNDFELRCTDIDQNETWLEYLDFRNYKEYRDDVLKFNPDYLFHLGAFTDLEYCEINPDETYVTNTLSVEHAVKISNELNIPLLFISTAGIFDGEKDFYDDWDLPNPIGVYARSKYMAERFVAENANKYLVCRAGWMMGSGPKKDKKFVNKIFKQLTAGKTEIFVVNDKDGTPTYTRDFVYTVLGLLDEGFWGIYNTVCGGQTSRLEVAQEILNILNLTEKVKITSVNSEYFKKEFFALRPNSERLVTAKLNLRGLNKMRDWRISLKEYLEKYFK
jgi:dTDP-4-dehydrorhamnose reductase